MDGERRNMDTAEENGILFITGGAFQGKQRKALSLFKDKRVCVVEAASLPSSWFLNEIGSDDELQGNNESVEGGIPGGENLDALIVNHMERIAPLLRKTPIEPETAVSRLIARLETLYPACRLVFIADEVGSGVVPLGGDERKERELAGRTAFLLASRATRVIRVLAGISMVIK